MRTRVPPATLPWILLLSLPAFAYLPVLWGTFNFDDVATILRSQDTTGWPFAWSRFRHPVGGRPLFWMTIALDRSLWEFRPAGYHLTNLLIHLLNTALLASLVRALARLTGSTGRGPALAAGLLFGLHPLASSAACYISERSTLLVAASALSVFRMLASATEPGARSFRRLGGATCLWLLGCLCKENAVVIPFCACPFLALLPAGPGKQAARRWALAACLASASFCLWTLYLPHGPWRDHPGTAQYALTECRVVWSYLRLWALPFHQALDADVSISSGWLSPVQTLAGGAGLLALLGWTCAGRRAPWLRAGACAALLALLPESSLVPLVDPMAEHRMYLPSALLAMGMAPAAVALAREPWALRAAGLLMILGLLLSSGRARVWSSETRPWQENLRVAPRKLRVHANLSNRYLALALERRRTGEGGAPVNNLFDASERLIRRAIRIRERPEQHRDLAKIAWWRGDDGKEREALELAIRGLRASGRGKEAGVLQQELERLAPPPCGTAVRP